MDIKTPPRIMKWHTPIRRVLLVSTNVCPYNDYRNRVMPTHLDYLASELSRHGIEATCLDLALEGAPFAIPYRTDPEAFHRQLYEQRKQKLATAISSGEYDMVGLSFRNMDVSLILLGERRPYELHFLDQLQGFTDVINESADRPYLVIGGPAFSLFPTTLMDRLCIDFGIVGAGEAALPLLISQINSGNIPHERLINTPFDFSKARFQRRFLDYRAYFKMAVAASVQTKRGCDALCSYCNYPAIEGRNYQLRPAEAVVDEIEELQQHDFQSFYFTDSVFNWPPRHAKAIMREIIRRGLDIRYNAMVNPRGIDEEFVDLAQESGMFKPATNIEVALVTHPKLRNLLLAIEEAKESGEEQAYSDGSLSAYGLTLPAFIGRIIESNPLRPRNLVLGVDSGDDAELAALGKGFNTSDIRQVTAMLKKRRIGVIYDFLFGGTATSEQSIRNSMRFAIESGLERVDIALGIRLYPQTELARATKGMVWQTEADLLGLTPYPGSLSPAQIMAIVQEYEGQIPIDFNI